MSLGLKQCAPIVAMLLAASALPAFGDDPVLVPAVRAVGGHDAAPPDSALADPCVVLIDQMPGASDVGDPSQDFEAGFDQYDTFAADDFTVPSGRTWNIDKIYFAGQSYAQSLPRAHALHCHIFANAFADEPAGCPVYGAPGIWHEAWTPDDPNVAFEGGNAVTLVPHSPPALGGGTYWLSCYPKLDFEPSGQWWWYMSDDDSGFLAKINNPGGGFAFPDGWNDVPDVIYGYGNGQAFTLWDCTPTTTTTTTTTHPPTTTVPTTTTTTTTTTGSDDDLDDDIVDDVVDDGADDADDFGDDQADDSAGDDSGTPGDDIIEMFGEENGFGRGETHSCGC